jgi:dTDP-4-dehydrorhamnose reductase
MSKRDWPENIAIIGASGFLGSFLYKKLSAAKTVGTRFSSDDEDLVKLDISKEESVKQFISVYKPELIIDCSGITRPDICERKPDLARKTNEEGPKHLAKYADCKVIYFSTDYVFDGGKGEYVEDDVPQPINVYGQTKLAAEDHVLGSCRSNLVVRVSGLYGYSKRNNDFLSSMHRNSKILAPTDVYSSHVYLEDIFEFLTEWWTASGIVHATDGIATSRYDFYKTASEILKTDTLVMPCKGHQYYVDAMRPQNSTLVSKRVSVYFRSIYLGLADLSSRLNTKNGLKRF